MGKYDENVGHSDTSRANTADSLENTMPATKMKVDKYFMIKTQH